MAVEDHREDYDQLIVDIERLRDCIAGQRAVQANSADYLRRPEGMKSTFEFNDYASHVPFFEATARTQEGLSGMAFYEDPEVDLPPDLKKITEDMTMDGVGLKAFAEGVLDEVLSTGRVGILADFPPRDEAVRSQAQAEAANRRPFAKIYNFESIFNWRSGTVRNARQLVEVRLLEREIKDIGDFEVEVEERIRVLELVGNDKDGWVYNQRVFVYVEQAAATASAAQPGSQPIGADNQKRGEWKEDDSKFVSPKIAGRSIEYIPFWLINPRDQTDALVKPPLLGLANANIAHFNTTAQLERVLSFVGSPQAWVAGGKVPDDVTLTVGSADAWIFPDVNTKVEYLQCGAEGVEAFESRLDRFEQHMALLGARMLAADKKGVETAETAGIHRQGEVSVLASICNSCSAGVCDVLLVFAEWQGTQKPKPNCFRINTAFFESPITGAEAVNLVKTWQSGGMAFSDLVAALKKGRVIAKDRTAEDIQAEIQSSDQSNILPGLTGGPAPAPAPGPGPAPAPRPRLSLPPKPLAF